MRFLVALVASSCVLGCTSPPAPPGDASTPGHVHVVFDPGAGDAIDFAQVPFPDDLYRNAEGGIELGAFPAELTQVAGEVPPDADMIRTMREALRDLDGFGTSAGVYFRVDGDVDPSSLPATPAASLQTGASVYMMDAESASPEAFHRIPVEVHWDAARRLIVVRPWYGHALYEGRTYAVVVTDAVRASDGTPLAASERFATIRDATARLSDTFDEAARTEYTPVLANPMVTRASVAGLAVYHVQHVSAELDEARTVIRSAPAPALTIRRVATGTDLDTLLGVPTPDELGTDVPGGVRHTHIGTLVDATFDSPSFLSPMPFGHGPFTHGTDGTLVIQRMDTVWLTLALPPGDVADLPLVVYQHGIGDDRSSIFAVADALCAEGFAVAAIDMPFHGMRADQPVVDMNHAFGSATGPDLFGDIGGTPIYVSFVGVIDATGPYAPFHPVYPRDALRQAAVDIMALVNALDRSDWSGLSAMGGPSGFSISSDPIGFVGVSLGGIVGTTFVTGEPRVGAAVLNVSGGELTNLVAFSAGFNSTFFPILLPRVGLDIDQLDYAGSPPRFLPQVALYQTLLDRGDSMAFAAVLANQPKHLLFQMAYDDETVPNQATESLARVAQASIVSHMPRYSDLTMVESPLASNWVLGATRVTRGLTVFDPATHGLLSTRTSEASVQHPPVPPFQELASPTPVANPVDDAVAQMTHFFVTFRSGTAEITE
ncbi:MAG: hypothetical protein U0234_15865 [Sandaracinus sp.]